MTHQLNNTGNELFLQIAKGNEQAFREVFHYYNSLLWPVVLRIIQSEQDAREIMQELFLRLWLQRNELPSIVSPEAWLYKVATNLSLDYLRKQATRTRHIIAAASGVEEQDESLLQQLDARYLKQQIEKAKDHLPAARREVFILSRDEGLSRAAIAEKLGISESTVKNQLTAALKFIQEYLQHHAGCYIPVALVMLLY